MEKYLEGRRHSPSRRFMQGIRKATIAGQDEPRAVRHFLSQQGRAAPAGCDCGLSALAAGHPAGHRHGCRKRRGHDRARQRPTTRPSPRWPLRSWRTRYVGKLAFFRVYSGTLKPGSYVYNSTKGKRERVGRILRMHANHREEIERGPRGRHRRRGGPEGHDHGRYAVRRKASRSSWNPWNSRSRSFAWPSSRRPRPARTR